MVLGVLAAASLLTQSGGPVGAPLQATVKTPAGAATALDSLCVFLNLSSVQLSQLQSLKEQSDASAAVLSERARANATALHQLLNSGAEPDAAKASALVLKERDLRAQLQNASEELAAKAAAILTPEQKQRLDGLSSMVETQREATPGLMPEAWPMLNAAAELGLVAAPPVR